MPEPTFSALTFGASPYDVLEREWKWAEDIGFDSVWVPDTFTVEGLADFETWTLLAAVARTTRRVRVGLSSLSSRFAIRRYSP